MRPPILPPPGGPAALDAAEVPAVPGGPAATRGVVEVHLRKRLDAFELAMTFVAPAGITALFGPSGAGKSQTLRCVAGLSRPDAGRIVAGGRVLFDAEQRVDLPARARGVGYLFQQYALFPHLDATANVAYGLHALSRSERTARAVALLRLVGLEDHARRYPRELSGGQQQRIALARALAPDPALLLLDEPFAAVDARLRGRLRRELRALHERTGVPMLLVTHDLADVRRLADAVVHVRAGRVVRVGQTLEVLAALADEGPDDEDDVAEASDDVIVPDRSVPAGVVGESAANGGRDW